MAFEKLNIVLADDDDDDREIFKLAISQIGVNTSLKMFKNGVELTEYLRQEDTILPNILFLDLNMPAMDGFECLREIKKNPGLGPITVIIYSTSSSEKDIEKTFLEGANIYINKPSDYETLKTVLKKVLTLDWQYQTSILNRDNFLFRF
ncbi:response regulator [Winogradskyella ursingii]|uniref:response regulator n=1 Tax=Winogradskyella ursingii TaxID=2686079 RepID=UPI0015CCB5BA|nr:response regulator [Winogradskyella ursingii]